MLKHRIYSRSRAFASGLAFLLLVQFAPSLIAQTGNGALRGKVTDASGGVIANATVTATSVETGQTQSAITETDGTYKLDVAPGNYRVKLEAPGFKTVGIPSVTVNGTETAVLDERLEVGDQTDGKPTRPLQENLPNAPSSSTTAPSLQDLGITPEQTQGNPSEQALLDKRTHMLKIHQRMGLITTIPLIATVATSLNAGGKSTSTASRDLHTALGGLTGDLYFITAYYAIRAPRVPGTETRGPIRFHKVMVLNRWARHDSDSHPGHYGLSYQKNKGGKSPWDRPGAWASGHRYGWGVWCRSFVSFR